VKGLLKNPLVVAFLAAGAVAAATANLVGPFLQQRRHRAVAPGGPRLPRTNELPAAGVALPNVPDGPTAITGAAAPPADRAYLGSWFSQSARQSRRNPFARPGRGGNGPAGGPVGPALELEAIWGQAEGRLALINGEIFAEGESVRGFTVTSIREDRVVVRGPNGSEEVRWKPEASGRDRPAPRPSPPTSP
jgi:hypothetical protein